MSGSGLSFSIRFRHSSSLPQSNGHSTGMSSSSSSTWQSDRTMIMKMHSYMATIGHVRHVSQQSAAILAQLRDVTSRVGGWEKAMADAKRRRGDLERETDTQITSTGASLSPFSIIGLRNGGVSPPYAEVPSATALRNGLMHVTAAETASEIVSDDDKPEGIPSHILVHHPDSQISALAKEYSELESELVSSGPERVPWPENITFKDFAMYQLIPTLVYELEYPRTKRIRPFRNLWHLRSDLYYHGDIHFTIYKSDSRTVFRPDVIGLGLPFMLAYLLFYIIFVSPIVGSMRTGYNVSLQLLGHTLMQKLLTVELDVLRRILPRGE
ncbi:hypothetical protein BC827DRAFT_1304570 [Russula dissimulans]|nr:hypothetical protein BC827DRAFT_1304570 [Russula dissimulans]